MQSNDESARPSKGLGFATSALVVMLLEFALVIDIGPDYRSEPILILFTVFGILCILQIVGILLVLAGHYRVGGILQIVASAAHVIDGFGVLGVIGGTNAMRHAKLESTEPPPSGDGE